ncbi:MAG: hypothetical protein RBR22_13860 [Desulfuromonas sp.]|nr:hypothetical protein [Desulfuromonas sp.]
MVEQEYMVAIAAPGWKCPPGAQATAEQRVIFFSGAMAALSQYRESLEDKKKKNGISKSTIKAAISEIDRQMKQMNELLKDAVDIAQPDFDIVVDHCIKTRTNL